MKYSFKILQRQKESETRNRKIAKENLKRSQKETYKKGREIETDREKESNFSNMIYIYNLHTDHLSNPLFLSIVRVSSSVVRHLNPAYRVSLNILVGNLERECWSQQKILKWFCRGKTLLSYSGDNLLLYCLQNLISLLYIIIMPLLGENKRQ